ncbi:MAG: efflux RND transporter permease subunit [bacterium]|nr:efflux RND transporter permease subunit [bacterium]
MEKIIDRPVLAVIFFTIIMLFGYYSYNNMTIELIPNPEDGLPSLTVTYDWLGVSPDVMLQKVLIPAENEIMQVKGVSELKSRATNGSGTLTVDFTRNTKMNFAHLVLKERLNRLQNDLPDSVRLRGITERVPDNFEQQPLFRIGLYGKDLSLLQLRKIAERDIQPYLRAISGIESAELYGGVNPEIKILVKMAHLKKFNISILQIQQQISRYFYSRQSLSFIKESGEISLSLSENPERIMDVQNVLLGRTGNKSIYLKDVADVYLGYEEFTTERRYQGKSFLVFILDKEPSHSHLAVAKRVRKQLQEIANNLESKIEFIIQSDESEDLREQLTRLSQIAFLILIIIFVILLIVVRDLRASILIFSSVFFSVFATITVIYLLDIDLNLLTLSGLALGFGLFVDNAVVVFDSILRHREKGYEPKAAAAQGARVVILPVLSSTFTTIIVFFSFAILFQDRLRIYYLPLAYVIAISLISSIAVSFVLIPSLASRLKLKTKKNPKAELFETGKFFPFILKFPITVVLPIVFVFIYTFNVFLEEVSFGQFFSWFNREQVVASLRFPSGAEFEDIKETILKFEKVALEKPYKKDINTAIRPRGAYMSVSFPEEIQNSAYPVQLKQELVGIATNLAGIGVRVSGFDQEPYFYSPDTGANMPYNIQIKGYNYEKLMEVANNLKRNLLNHRRIKDAEIQTDMEFWWGGNDKYYSFEIDREKLKRYRLSPRLLVTLIYTNLRESSATINRLRFDDKDLNIMIKATDVEELELDDILNKTYQIPGISDFRIKDVVDVGFFTQRGGITRENQEYVAMVQWDYLGSAKAGDRHHTTVYNNLQVPVGFSKSLEERQFRMTDEEESQIQWAIWISLGLIYLILGMLYENFFQPILILLAVPLALIGVFISFVALNYSFDSAAYIGVILLFGIVVNNAILLIDNINHHLSQHPRIVEAIAVATKERIRPIIMTTLTTVLGMMPLLIIKESSGSSDIWSNLALCTVGGLTTSAMLILLVLPIFYYQFYKLQQYIFPNTKKTIDSNETFPDEKILEGPTTTTAPPELAEA